MGRTIRIVALIAIAMAGTAAIGFELFYLHWFRSVVAQGNRAHLEIAPDVLERELRTALPPGASRAAVESALRDHQIPFNYDNASREIRAGVRYLKGSNPIVETGLSLTFHFDGTGALANFDSRVVYTGP